MPFRSSVGVRCLPDPCVGLASVFLGRLLRSASRLLDNPVNSRSKREKKRDGLFHEFCHCFNNLLRHPSFAKSPCSCTCFAPFELGSLPNMSILRASSHFFEVVGSSSGSTPLVVTTGLDVWDWMRGKGNGGLGAMSRKAVLWGGDVAAEGRRGRIMEPRDWPLSAGE